MGGKNKNGSRKNDPDLTGTAHIVVGFCENCNEPWVIINDRHSLHLMSDHQLLNNLLHKTTSRMFTFLDPLDKYK
jgi:hypothetical protein